MINHSQAKLAPMTPAQLKYTFALDTVRWIDRVSAP